jgi:hypothetical protein
MCHAEPVEAFLLNKVIHYLLMAPWWNIRNEPLAQPYLQKKSPQSGIVFTLFLLYFYILGARQCIFEISSCS